MTIRLRSPQAQFDVVPYVRRRVNRLCGEAIGDAIDEPLPELNRFDPKLACVGGKPAPIAIGV
jgi:hypothetical protein